MGIVELATGRRLMVAIAPVEHKDFRQITKKNHFFDWKKERGIAGCLFAFVGEIALEKYFEQACISLLPKTELRSHYKSKYGMLDGGPGYFWRVPGYTQ
jgi:hypothetical protein